MGFGGDAVCVDGGGGSDERGGVGVWCECVIGDAGVDGVGGDR
jgi:hypothetical protein